MKRFGDLREIAESSKPSYYQLAPNDILAKSRCA